MFCSISGQIPQEPVFALSTGHVYEKRLIEKALEASSGKCPVTGKVIEKDQLQPIETNTAIAPRLPETTSITNLLKTFQSEWDAVLLETHSLKKSLHETRQQLSQALYQNDAANRVIGRLLKEREQLRQQLASGVAVAQPNSNGKNADNGQASKADMEVDKGDNTTSGKPFEEDVVAAFCKFSQEILPTLKKDRPLPDNYTTADMVSKYVEIGKYSPHSVSKVGINCVSVHPSNGNILTGGNDNLGKLFSVEKKQVVGTLRGHKKKVVDARFVPNSDRIVTGSDDNTCRIFSPSGGRDHFKSTKILQYHKSGGVNGINVHPCGSYMVSTANDKTMGFWDLEKGEILCDVSYQKIVRCPVFHPNGMLLSMALGDSIALYDVRSSVDTAALTLDGHNAGVSSVAFSPIGTHVASGDTDGVVKIWDLRKKNKGKSGDIATLNESGAITSVAFDYGNKYVSATSGDIVKVWEFKKWDSTIFQHSYGKDFEVLDAAFSHNSSYLAVVGNSRYLQVHGV